MARTPCFELANCLFIRAVSKVLFAQEVLYLTLITVAMLSQLATVAIKDKKSPSLPALYLRSLADSVAKSFNIWHPGPGRTRSILSS